ncbi:MFS transporter [Pigmentibacter ruber]|uniref:MFS transporter n=1 Tax=Pigmentibacter ruber TaxID=2683196 RepID=UPI00131C3D78|nr:MFS transporter [Pigmentibacter ruber]
MSKNNKNIQLYIILFGVFWTKAAAILSMPFLTLFLHNKVNLSLTAIGFIVGIQPLAVCFGGLIGGYLSDIFKKRNIMLISVLSSGFIFICFYLTSFIQNTFFQFLLFAFLNLLNGFSSAFFTPISRVILTELASNSEENIKFMHMRYIAINLSATVGPLLGAYAGIAANSSAFLITAIAYLIYFFILLISVKHLTLKMDTSIKEDKFKNFFTAFKLHISNKPFFYLLLSTGIFSMLYVQMNTNLALIIEKNITQGTIFFSWMLSLNAILVILIQPLIYLITKKMRQKIIYFVGFLINIFAGASLFISPISKISIIAFFIFLSVAEVLIYPVSGVLTAEMTDDKNKGIAFGLLDLTNLGSAIGPLFGGFLLQHYATKGFAIGFLAVTIISSIFIVKKIFDQNPQIEAKIQS